jgi:hypothetical protein
MLQNLEVEIPEFYQNRKGLKYIFKEMQMNFTKNLNRKNQIEKLFMIKERALICVVLDFKVIVLIKTLKKEHLKLEASKKLMMLNNNYSNYKRM